MHQGALAPSQQDVLAVSARVAIVLVLHLSAHHRLGELGLQLNGCHWDAVAEQHEVDGLVWVRDRIVHLPDHPQDVALIVLHRLGVHRLGRFGLHHLEPGRDTPEALPEHR